MILPVLIALKDGSPPYVVIIPISTQSLVVVFSLVPHVIAPEIIPAFLAVILLLTFIPLPLTDIAPTDIPSDIPIKSSVVLLFIDYIVPTFTPIPFYILILPVVTPYYVLVSSLIVIPLTFTPLPPVDVIVPLTYIPSLLTEISPSTTIPANPLDTSPPFPSSLFAMCIPPPCVSLFIFS